MGQHCGLRHLLGIWEAPPPKQRGLAALWGGSQTCLSPCAYVHVALRDLPQTALLEVLGSVGRLEVRRASMGSLVGSAISFQLLLPLPFSGW